MWTYKIPQYSKTDQLEWAFIFANVVDFNDPSKVSLPNYIASLKELMNNFQVQKYGFFYLGICGPDFDNDSKPLISTHMNKSLLSTTGYGYCLHASAITTHRSRLF